MILRGKILLLWLLALAIPVQGFAAALQACAPAMTPAVAAQPHLQPQTMQSAHIAHRHDHHAGHAMPAADQLKTADAAPAHDVSHGVSHDAPHHAQHKTASCSYCAACTGGAVFPLALNAPPAPDFPTREFIALPAYGFVGFLPENPDRPPALA